MKLNRQVYDMADIADWDVDGIWTEKETGNSIKPTITIQCLHGDELDALRIIHNMSSGVFAGCDLREVLKIWAKYDFKQIHLFIKRI